MVVRRAHLRLEASLMRVHEAQASGLVAAVHAAGLVDANPAFAGKTKLLDALLCVRLHLGSAAIVATGFGWLALVAAEKDVTLVVTQSRLALMMNYTRASVCPHPGRPESHNRYTLASRGHITSTACVSPLKLSR